MSIAIEQLGQRRIQMRTKLMVAILLGMTGTLLQSSPSSAGQIGIPGAMCKIVTSSNVEAANTSFSGPYITNNSASTLYVYCPIQLDAFSYPYSLWAYGNSKSMPSTCSVYYNTSATSYTVITAAPYSSGSDRIADFSLPSPPMENGAFRCAMGASGSSFYNALVNTSY